MLVDLWGGYTFTSVIQLACTCSLSPPRCEASPRTELSTSRGTQYLLGWSLVLLPVLYFCSDHWMLFLANVKYACSFTDSSFHFIFSLLEKLIWCTDNNKGCQTTVVVTAKLKRNNKRKPTSYFTVSLCDIPPMKNSAHGLIRGDKQEQFFNGKNCHMTFQIKFKKKLKKVKLQKTFCTLKIKK